MSARSRIPLRTPRPRGETAVASPDGRRQAVYALGSGRDQPNSTPEIRIRDAAGKQLLIFPQHTAPIRDAYFSPDGQLVISQAWNGEMKIWETDSGKVRWEANLATLYKGRTRFSTVAGHPGCPRFSPDGRLLTLPGPEGVKIVATADFQEVSLVDGTSSDRFPWPMCFFGPGNQRLVLISTAQIPNAGPGPAPLGRSELRLWDVIAGREIKSVTLEDEAGPSRLREELVSFSPDGRLFAVLPTRRGNVTIFDTATGEQRSLAKGAATGQSSLLACVFSPDGTRLLVTSSGGAPGTPPRGPTVWDVATGKLLFRLEGHGGAVSRTAFSPDGKRVATYSSGRPRTGEVKLWDAATGRELLSLQANVLANDLKFSPDGHRLFARSRPGMSLVPEEQELVWDATPREQALGGR
jgi:WD40 repeat protein